MRAGRRRQAAHYRTWKYLSGRSWGGVGEGGRIRRKGAGRALAGTLGRAVGWPSARTFWSLAQAQNTRWRTRAREGEGRGGESREGCEGVARKGCRKRGDDIHFYVWGRGKKKT